MFIYVYGIEMKEKLISLGYDLIKNTGDIYIFQNRLDVKFDTNDIYGKYVITDVLTF